MDPDPSDSTGKRSFFNSIFARRVLGIPHTEIGCCHVLRRSPRLLGMSDHVSGISPSPLIRTTRLRGMSNPERGSSQFASRKSLRLPDKFPLRRSPRLLGNSALRKSPRLLGKSAKARKSPAKGKSAVTMPESPLKSPAEGKIAMPIPEHSRISPRKSPDQGKSAMIMPESPRESPAKDSDSDSDSDSDPDALDYEVTISKTLGFLDIAAVMRSDRQAEAQNFRRSYIYHSDCHENKTCIHPDGDFSWKRHESSGFTYVAVRGMYSTCVVFKRSLEHVKDRLQNSYLEYNMPQLTCHLFGMTAISEIEDLADLSSKSRQSVVNNNRIDEPFAIVSVDPSNPNGYVEDKDKVAVVKYFQDILKKDTVLPPSELKEVAIHAFQLLYKQKFKPEDIWVSVASFSDYDDLTEHELKFILSVMNETDADKYEAYMAICKRLAARPVIPGIC